MSRFAFYGRVSTDEDQDPSLSIPRQRNACGRVLTPDSAIVAHYWDVESGRKALAERGQFTSDAQVDVPRDGGLPELLAHAGQPGAPFDAVIVESIDRLSRRTSVATRIEDELDAADITLVAADEPQTLNASAILTRRVKQGVAEWYVRDLIEKSRRGMEESVRQGWHPGGPAPYGYLLEPHPHPNPHKAREGKKKHKLALDPERAPIVLMIFEDYCLNGLGLGELCEKLNGDPKRYPPPAKSGRDKSDLAPTWSRSQLHFLLRNPRYTGFTVWGRHDKRRGRPTLRPPNEWTWSSAPSHPAIVSRELFDQVEGRARTNENSNRSPLPASQVIARPRKPGRFYVLRGLVRCAYCGRRMEGSHQKDKHWYRCRYRANRGLEATQVSGHPPTVGIREERVLETIDEFMSRRLFGPDRLPLLYEQVKSLKGKTPSTTDERSVLKERIAELQLKIQRQTRHLDVRPSNVVQHDDPRHPVAQAAKHRIAELSAEEAEVTDELSRARPMPSPEPTSEELAGLVETVPDLRGFARKCSRETIRELFEAFELEAVYDKEREEVRLKIVLSKRAAEIASLLSDGNQFPQSRSGIQFIAGAEFEPATFGL